LSAHEEFCGCGEYDCRECFSAGAGAGSRTGNAWLDEAIVHPRTRVVHCRRERFDVFIGRTGRWGNPFVLGRDGDRQEVIEKYRAWLRTQPQLVARARRELAGRVLGCYCAPLTCHGDILAAIADGGAV
jgi:hypothetical protein